MTEMVMPPVNTELDVKHIEVAPDIALPPEITTAVVRPATDDGHEVEYRDADGATVTTRTVHGDEVADRWDFEAQQFEVPVPEGEA